MGTEDPQVGSQTVRRAMALLRLVACSQERGVRLSELVALSGLNRPTVHRLLQTLIQEGALEQDIGSRRYLLGPEMVLLGLARKSRHRLAVMADPYLAELARETGDTAFLSIRHGTDSICVSRQTGHHPIQILSIEVGARRPLGLGVSGVALLACLSEADCADAVAQNERRLASHGESSQSIIHRVGEARRLGYAHAPVGLMPGTSAVSVSVPDTDGRSIGALTITAMADRLNEKRLPIVLAAMQRGAMALSRRAAEADIARPERR